MIPKEKGIIFQSVKEVLQSLVDDHLVNCEKIGISNYYWSFPSAAMNIRNQKVALLRADIEGLAKREENLLAQIASAGEGREDCEERDEMLREWKECEREMARANSELDDYKENDPLLHETRKREVLAKRAAANRWTENILTVQSYCASNFSISKDQLMKAFQIPSDLDYV